MNKVDGRLNRLLAHASSALQDGIQKKRSEGTSPPNPTSSLARNLKPKKHSGAIGTACSLIGQKVGEQEPVDHAVRD